MDKLSQMDKSSDVKTGRTNFQTVVRVCQSVYLIKLRQFSKMICSSTQTSHPKFNLNSHLDEQMGNLPVMQEWKVNVEEGIKAAKKGTKKQKEHSLTTSDSN